MKWGKKKSVGDNDAFVTLIRVAQEDPEIRATLSGILRQPPFHRKSLLSTLIEDMKANGAPPDFASAMAELLDDGVAQKAAEIMAGRESQHPDASSGSATRRANDPFVDD